MNWFKQIKEKIKLYYINKDISLSGKYLFIEDEDKNILNQFIDKTAREIAGQEDLKIFFVPFDEMNKDEKDINKKAVGRFIFFEKSYNYGLKIFQYKTSLIKSNKYSNDEINRLTTYPRIELSEKSDELVIIHELGHYFLYKRGMVQSEKAADAYIKEFFETYLPPFFKWLYQIDIQIRYGTKEKDYQDGKYKFTNLECYNYYNDFKNFINATKK